MSRVQRMRRQAIVSLDSISNTISRQRRRRCRQYAPLALCLLLSAFAAVTFCRRLPAATAAAIAFAFAAAAATLHSDCSNLTENVACATATFSLLRASVVPAMLTSSLTPTPTLTEKLTASAAVRVRVFTMDRAYRHLPE